MACEESLLFAQPKVKKVITYLPPDGGWGWMVLLGTAICNIFNQSMVSLFSLLYGDALEAMGHEIQGAAIVTSTMFFVTNFSGPIAGAIVKLTSTRFVAVTGACLSTLGIFLSGLSTNIIHLMMSYGFLLGLGLGFVQNSSYVSINSYFKLRKSRAVGLAHVGTGVGQTLMPHLVSYLLENYGFQGTTMLLSSMSLHGIVGTLLIQPVSWHMKKIEEEVVIDEKLNLLPENNEVQNVYRNRRAIEPELTNDKKQIGFNGEISQSNNKLSINVQKLESHGANERNVFVSPVKTWWKKLSDLLDLTLLKSPRFINIIFGISLAVTSTHSFSMLYPYFLQKTANMNKRETAMCMSAVAIADIVGRLSLPAVQDKYRIRARWMFVVTCTCLTIVRQILAYQGDLRVLLVMSCLYGFGRSMIIVARNIAISENCRIDQVPAAVGLGMLSMGLMTLPVGYILGWIRDYTGSYIICITAQNFLLVLLIILWIPDMLYLKIQERNRKVKEIELEHLHN